MTTEFIDHETRTLDQFKCPQCGMALELIEVRHPAISRLRSPSHYEFVGACRRCEIAIGQDAWHKKLAL